MQDNKESRKFERHSVDVMKLIGRMPFKSMVEILDISLGGISFHIDRALKTGSSYVIRISMDDHSLSLAGTVAWAVLRESRKLESGGVMPIYTVGMQFNAMPADTINMLTSFIASHKKEEKMVTVNSLNCLRFDSRFHLEESGSSVLTHPEHYTVKKISLGGMLIETDHELTLQEKMPMEIMLPGDGNLSFSGEVTSCIPVEHTDALHNYEVGIKFLDLSAENTARLRSFIDLLEGNIPSE